MIAFTILDLASSSGAAKCLEALRDACANATATSQLDFSFIPCCYSQTLKDNMRKGRREQLGSRFQGVQGGSEQEREGRSHVSYPSYTPIGPPIPVKFSDCRNNFACGHVAQSLAQAQQQKQCTNLQPGTAIRALRQSWHPLSLFLSLSLSISLSISLTQPTIFHCFYQHCSLPFQKGKKKGEEKQKTAGVQAAHLCETDVSKYV